MLDYTCKIKVLLLPILLVGSSGPYAFCQDTVAVFLKVPTELGLSSFYKKYRDADSIPIVSSAQVPDEALDVAKEIVLEMLRKIPLVKNELISRKLRIAVMAQGEVTTDIPEHSDLYIAFPATDWDQRARGLGATLVRPATSCAEENLLCYPTDRYLGENILVHEFAHSIHLLGLIYEDLTFVTRLRAAYEHAQSTGLWENTYAISNVDEYWAEGVQSWFSVNQEAIPTDGIHNEVNTHQELKEYDPTLYSLVSNYFLSPARAKLPHCD